MDTYSQIGNEQNLSRKASLVAVENTDRDKRRKYACSICGQRFLKAEYLNRHERIHTGEKPFKCPTCEKCFLTEVQCDKHMIRIHTNKGRFKCQFCDKRFKFRAEVKIHERIHTGEKPFKCPTCELRFAMKSNYNRHMKRVHINEKPLKCRFCDKRFNISSDCKQHERTHAGAKSFKCPTCEKCFRLKSYLNKHINRAHNY